jgi:transcriptional regulator with PAS, ATPase and Fis domain
MDLAAVMSDEGEIQPKDITFNTILDEENFLLKEMTLEIYTFRIIRSYLNKYDNNVLEVAKRLDIGKSSIYRYLKDMEAAGI